MLPAQPSLNFVQLWLAKPFALSQLKYVCTPENP